jgi:S1-C subfamily serine protease
VKNVSKFRNEIGMMTPSAAIKLLVLRDDKKITLNATLGALEGETISTELIQKLGIELENLTPELSSKLGYNSTVDGIVITKIKSGSPSALAGLRPGFLITGVAINWTDQKPVRSTSEFEEALKDVGDKKHLILIVRHQNFQRYYTVKLG